MSRERKPAPDVEHMHTLKVDNLSSRTTEADLKEVFGKHGEVGDVYIPRNYGTMEPRGFAFVRFIDRQEAEDAMAALDGKDLDGRDMRIQEARQRRPANPRDAYLSRSRYDDRRGDDRGRDRYDDRRDDRGRDRYDDRRDRYDDRRDRYDDRRDRYDDRRDDRGGRDRHDDRGRDDRSRRGGDDRREPPRRDVSRSRSRS